MEKQTGVPDFGVAQGHTLGIPAGTPARIVEEDIGTHYRWSILRRGVGSYSWTSCLNMKRFY